MTRWTCACLAVLASLAITLAGCGSEPGQAAAAHRDGVRAEPLIIEHDGIRVSAARIRAVIPGQDKTAGYFTLENSGDRPLELASAASPMARAIEFHITERAGDRVSMRRLSKIVVQPGERVEFAPGGRHLMIFGIDAAFEHFSATLNMDDGREIEVPFQKLPLGGE